LTFLLFLLYNNIINKIGVVFLVKIIGLCGGSGSGKGTVADLFIKFGIPSVDTDAVYHQLTSHTSDCLLALVEEFGVSILTDSGALNRKKLSEVVFTGDGSDKRRARLNAISHKYVLDETRKILRGYAENGKVAALVDAPLLFESGFYRECDAVIAVVADKAKRIERIVFRDGLDEAAAVRRIESQISDEHLKEVADFVIENSGSLSELECQVELIAKKILE